MADLRIESMKLQAWQESYPGAAGRDACPDKRRRGQFFTVGNPFQHEIFHAWLDLIPPSKKETILEPFAGSNNIIMMTAACGLDCDWRCFDINDGLGNIVPQHPINRRDTIRNFPRGYFVAITNPPYLAKNSATRKGVALSLNGYDDLYKLCLHVMLENLEFVGAIIPESFVTSGLFHYRLFGLISLPCKMFKDTDCPVCLALFVPPNGKAELGSSDFHIYSGQRYLGTYKQLCRKVPVARSDFDWNFNDPAGEIGIRCIDNLVEPSIRFVEGREIDRARIKVSSRSLTRVSGLPEGISIQDFLARCNKKLVRYRKETGDIFLTSFKGLRSDGQYRRRLDFKNARLIMNTVIDEISGNTRRDSALY